MFFYCHPQPYKLSADLQQLPLTVARLACAPAASFLRALQAKVLLLLAKVQPSQEREQQWSSRVLASS
jgi:hypothetical protein